MRDSLGREGCDGVGFGLGVMVNMMIWAYGVSGNNISLIPLCRRYDTFMTITRLTMITIDSKLFPGDNKLLFRGLIGMSFEFLQFIFHGFHFVQPLDKLFLVHPV